jgi:hypothetical protein
VAVVVLVKLAVTFHGTVPPLAMVPGSWKLPVSFIQLFGGSECGIRRMSQEGWGDLQVTSERLDWAAEETYAIPGRVSYYARQLVLQEESRRDKMYQYHSNL